MTDVFISYSRKDKAFVQKLHQALAQHGKEMWVDWESIPLTADWWAEIQEGIEAADAFAFIISPDSTASEVCQKELAHAAGHNKRLIPIVYRDAADVPAALRHLNWIFLREMDDFEGTFETLLATLALDLDWVKRHTRLTRRAREWAKRERNDSYLLRGDDLAEAEQHLSQPDRTPALTSLQQEYIVASQQKQANDLLRELEQAKALAETEQRRLAEQERYTAQLRRRSIIIISSLALVIALGGVAILIAVRNGAFFSSTEQVVDAIVEYGDAEVNRDVCLAGALNGVPKLVLSTCAQAVDLEPDEPLYRESRGMAYALSGNFSAAATDFKAAIELARERNLDAAQLAQWEAWVSELDRGRNPFDSPLLKQLRDDWRAGRTVHGSGHETGETE